MTARYVVPDIRQDRALVLIFHFRITYLDLPPMSHLTRAPERTVGITRKKIDYWESQGGSLWMPQAFCYSKMTYLCQEKRKWKTLVAKVTKEYRYKLKLKKNTQDVAQESNSSTIEKILKKASNRPYQEALSFPKTFQIALFKSKNYKVSAPIELNYFSTRPNVCVLYKVARPNLVWVYVRNSTWLDIVL